MLMFISGFIAGGVVAVLVMLFLINKMFDKLSSTFLGW